MSADMQGYLFDTLVWTAALIALVLLLRRPVARHFGTQAAYALWLLPFLRLLLPPITLPAWLAPAPAEPDIATEMFILTGDPAALALEAGPVPIAQPATTSIDWATLLLTVWLVGAALFLVRRFQLYFRMRRDMLADASPVGEAGEVRLVETPAATSPVAFGVLDKVVALPPGFMAWHDRAARDLALEHELAHHRGHDLLANFATQPLFALHWFNPLAWAGWRAMRRDQEAACDARVVARRAREERATYAEVIAGFAAGPNVALAAPMACPVLGEKSIIHRLRSLNMSDISPRRRIAGRAMLAAGVLALPLTASISYAESVVAPEPPAAPSPVVAPLPPTAPVPPNVAAAPPAPPAPLAPLALQAGVAAADAADDEDENVFVVRVTEEDENGERRKIVERHRKVYKVDRKELSEEERARIRAEIKRELADVEVHLDEARKAHKQALIELRRDGVATKIEVDCKDGERTGEWKTEDGQRVLMLCKSKIHAQALTGLREARNAIARNAEMDKEIREQVLRALDEQIARWSADR